MLPYQYYIDYDICETKQSYSGCCYQMVRIYSFQVIKYHIWLFQEFFPV